MGQRVILLKTKQGILRERQTVRGRRRERKTSGRSDRSERIQRERPTGRGRSRQIKQREIDRVLATETSGRSQQTADAPSRVLLLPDRTVTTANRGVDICGQVLRGLGVRPEGN